MNEEFKPWQCPNHPDSKIRHSWDRIKYTYNGHSRGMDDECNHKYECLECGLELALLIGEKIE